MAQDLPSAPDLLAACRRFLEDEVVDALDGRLRFHTRVAVNVLGVVERELRDGPAADAIELAGVASLLGHDGDLHELNAELARSIRDGSLEDRHQEVLAHVRRSVEAKVRVYNPGYVGASVPRGTDRG